MLGNRDPCAQACDLGQDKTTRVVVAPIHEAAELVAKNILKAGAVRDQVRRGQVFGWYFLQGLRISLGRLGAVGRSVPLLL